MVGNHLSEWFAVLIGVRQGCLLSSTLFNIFLEYVMLELATTTNSDSMFRQEMCLDVRYTDDELLSKLTAATKQLERACKKWDLLVNGGKCKVLTTENQHIEIDGRSLENVHAFLGIVVPGISS